MSMMCAVLGIPLLLIYLSVVGNCLARGVKRIYSCCSCCGNSSSSSSRRRQQQQQQQPHSSSSSVTNNLAPGESETDLTLNRQQQQQQWRQGQKRRSSASSTSCCRDCVQAQLLCRKRGHKAAMQQMLLLQGSSSNSPEEQQLIHSAAKVPLWACLLLIFSYIALGATIFSLSHGWNFLDSFFFCFTILSTIGIVKMPTSMGDSSSSSQSSSISGQSRQKRGIQDRHKDEDGDGGTGFSAESDGLFVLFCSLYLLLGLALMSMCFNLLTSSYSNLSLDSRRESSDGNNVLISIASFCWPSHGSSTPPQRLHSDSRSSLCPEEFPS